MAATIDLSRYGINGATEQEWRITYMDDVEEHIIPSASNMGFWSFAAYTFMCMFVVHAVFYLLDAFMLSNFRLTLLSTFAGTVLATVLALFVDMIVNSSKD